MRSKEKYGLLLTMAVLLAMVLWTGCSDRRENPVFPDIHPDSWMDSESVDFHGTRVLAVGTDFCYECHGVDATGGVRAVACFQCHDSENECVTCHGDPANGTGAPPVDLSGNTTIDNIGVGAHTTHVEGNGGFSGFACDVCHTVPVTQASPGHQDTPLPAEVTFARSATIGGIDAVWDRSSMTCSGIVCHGAGNTSPLWTETHDFECTDCHGDPSRVAGSEEFDPGPAPPRDLNGAQSTATAGVGAHESHVTTGPLRIGIDCDECHIKPSSVEDAEHIESDPPFRAEIVWGDLAGQSTSPSYVTGDSPSCTDVYCHGGAFDQDQKGSMTEPVWTIVDGSQSACGTCHEIPPHDDFGFGCDICHGSVVAADTTITTEGKSLHINGTVNF